MAINRHLYVALSGHGFGHLAQVAPVLNAWRRRWPAARLTLQSALPEAALRQRIDGPFECVALAADFGMVMVDALQAKIPESLAAYRDFHAEWERRLAEQEGALRAAEPDGVLADVPYLTLAAAQRLRIPALALCSLNWADILAGYCSSIPDLAELRKPMLSAYNSARAFLQPAPSMPMPDLNNVQKLGPIAAVGRNRRAEIDRRLGLREREIVVLMGLGGTSQRTPGCSGHASKGGRISTPPNWAVSRPDMLDWGVLEDCSMVDLIRSCDVLFTKPGYGAFTEAACNGARALYVARDDWPEEPWLSRWLMEHGNAVKVGRSRLDSGDLADALRLLLEQPAKPPVEPGGIAEAVGWLERLLDSA